MKKNSSTYCFSNSGVNFTSLTHLNGRSWQTLECKLTSQFTISYSLKCISMWCCFYVYYLTATFIDLNLPKIPAVFKYVLYGQIKVTLTNIRVWGPFGLRGGDPTFFFPQFFWQESASLFRRNFAEISTILGISECPLPSPASYIYAHTEKWWHLLHCCFKEFENIASLKLF